MPSPTPCSSQTHHLCPRGSCDRKARAGCGLLPRRRRKIRLTFWQQELHPYATSSRLLMWCLRRNEIPAFHEASHNHSRAERISVTSSTCSTDAEDRSIVSTERRSCQTDAHSKAIVGPRFPLVTRRER